MHLRVGPVGVRQVMRGGIEGGCVTWHSACPWRWEAKGDQWGLWYANKWVYWAKLQGVVARKEFWPSAVSVQFFKRLDILIFYLKSPGSEILASHSNSFKHSVGQAKYIGWPAITQEGLLALGTVMGMVSVHSKASTSTFPGGPVVRTLRFHCPGLWFSPWSGK